MPVGSNLTQFTNLTPRPPPPPLRHIFLFHLHTPHILLQYVCLPPARPSRSPFPHFHARNCSPRLLLLCPRRMTMPLPQHFLSDWSNRSNAINLIELIDLDQRASYGRAVFLLVGFHWLASCCFNSRMFCLQFVLVYKSSLLSKHDALSALGHSDQVYDKISGNN